MSSTAMTKRAPVSSDVAILPCHMNSTLDIRINQYVLQTASAGRLLLCVHGMNCAFRHCRLQKLMHTDISHTLLASKAESCCRLSFVAPAHEAFAHSW